MRSGQYLGLDLPSAAKDNYPQVSGKEYHYQSIDFVCKQESYADNLADAVDRLFLKVIRSHLRSVTSALWANEGF